MRGKVAVGLSALLLLLLPAGGLAAGGYAGAQWARPTGPVCGMYPYITLTAIGFGALVGLAAGLASAWVTALGLFRWANGCGLGDIREDGFDV